jgi:hypothetical protein
MGWQLEFANVAEANRQTFTGNTFMRPQLPRLVPTAIAQCFDSAPPPPADTAAPEPVPSLAMQLQDKEPTLKQKIIANRLSRRLCFTDNAKDEHVRSRALVRPGLQFSPIQMTSRAPVMLQGLLQAATSVAGRHALKTEIFERFKDPYFLYEFATVAASGESPENNSFYGGSIRRLANDLGPAIDQAFSQHIADRVAAAMGKDVPTPVAIEGGAGRVVAVRVERQLRLTQEEERVQKCEEVIKGNPLVAVLGLRDVGIQDHDLYELGDPQYLPEKISTLFTELIASGTTEADKSDLKKALVGCFSSDHERNKLMMSQFFFVARCLLTEGQKLHEPGSYEYRMAERKADELAGLACMHPVLDRIFAGPIAAWVAQLGCSGSGSSDEVVAALPVGVGFLVEARAKAHSKTAQESLQREETIQNHPV